MLAPVLVTAALGGAFRLWLMPRYAGWEESDYGNLAMIRGVLESGFRHYDMNHMPGYYALGALVLLFVGDAQLAALAVSWSAGVLVLVIATGLVVREAGAKAGWLAGLLLLVQPELALYSSTSLREPVYAMWVLGMLAAMGAERLVLAGVFAALAFTVRMDALAALTPALLLHAWGGSRRLARLVALTAPMATTVVAWAAYCQQLHGTWRFWAGSVENNLRTGGVHEDGGRLQEAVRGLELVAGLWTHVAPVHLGVLPCLLALVAAFRLRTLPHGLLRTATVAFLGLLGVWSGIAFFAQHELGHNLYWKWLTQLVPVAVVVGVTAAAPLTAWLSHVLGQVGAALLLAIFVGQALVAQVVELRRQVEVSATLYRPQRELGEWLETQVPEDVPMVMDNIPGRWLDRRVHQRQLWSWFDVPSAPGDLTSFTRWLRAERIGWVLWFREEWTQAPVVAPFLSTGGTIEHDGVRLTEAKREDSYGWILYRVESSSGLDSSPGLR
jgi:hypothetical protein